MLDTFVLFKLCRAEVSHRELVCLLGPEPTSCCTPARLPAQEQTQKPSWSGLSAPVTSPPSSGRWVPNNRAGKGSHRGAAPRLGRHRREGRRRGSCQEPGGLSLACVSSHSAEPCSSGTGVDPQATASWEVSWPPGWGLRVGRPSAGLSWRSELASAQRSRHGSLPCSGQTPDRQEGHRGKLPAALVAAGSG